MPSMSPVIQTKEPTRPGQTLNPTKNPSKVVVNGTTIFGEEINLKGVFVLLR